MVGKFNPDVPQEAIPLQPFYQRVRPFMGDDSSSFVIKGVGDAFKTLATGIDKGIEMNIDQDLNTQTDAVKDAYTAALEADKSALNGTNQVFTNLSPFDENGNPKPVLTPNLQPAATGPDLGMPQPEAPGNVAAQPVSSLLGIPNSGSAVPTDIKNFTDFVQNNQAAFDQGLNPSRTLYLAKMDQIAKDFRNRYPGYRDYIDRKISTITGGDPANLRIESLLGDIKASVSAGKEAQNRILTQGYKAISDGVPGAEGDLINFRAGNTTLAQYERDLEHHISVYSANKAYIQRQKDLIEINKDNQAFKSAAAANIMEKTAQVISAGDFNTMQVAAGTNTKVGLNEFITRAAAGTIPGATAQNIRTLIPQINAAFAVSQKKILAQFNQPLTGADGKPILGPDGQPATAMSLAPDKAQAALDHSAMMWKTAIDALNNQQYGLANLPAQLVKDKAADTSLHLLQDKPSGDTLAQVMAVYKMGGTQVGESYLKELNTSQPGMLDHLATQLLHNNTKAMTQPGTKFSLVTSSLPGTSGGVSNTANNNGQIFTMRDHFADAAATAARTGDPTLTSPQYNEQIFQLYSHISDPKMPDEIKANLARSAFDPRNAGLLRQFPQDHFEGGHMVPGQNTLFDRLYNEKNTQEIKRLSASDPSIWKNYVISGEQTFANDLFPQLIADAQSISKIPGVTLSWDTDNTRWNLNFDNARFVRESGEQGTSTGPASAIMAKLASARQTIDKLNSGIRNVANIAKADGSDPNAYVLQVMSSKLGGPGNDNIAQQMYTSLLAAHAGTHETLGAIPGQTGMKEVPQDHAFDNPVPYTSTLGKQSSVTSNVQTASASAPTALETKVAQTEGFDPNLLHRIVHIESSGNPNATTGSHIGLLQLTNKEFKKYGNGGSITDPEANLTAGVRSLKDKISNFQTQFGREPTATEIYLMHQQGEAGLRAHEENPDQLAWKSMLSTGEGKRKGAKWAKEAIWGNVPDPLKPFFGDVNHITSGEFIALWEHKLEGTPFKTALAQVMKNSQVAAAQ